MKNKYSNYSRISEPKFRWILKCFSLDLTSSNTAKLSGLSRNTINSLFNKFRIHIFESYFGAKRVRGKRGRGAAGKTPVFGLLKRDGNVYVEIVKNCSREQLMPIIQGKILE